MTNDLVERLNGAYSTVFERSLAHEAAAEIERLRERVAALEADRKMLSQQLTLADRRGDKAEAERDQAVKRLTECSDGTAALLWERDALRQLLQQVRGLYQVTHIHAAIDAARERP